MTENLKQAIEKAIAADKARFGYFAIVQELQQQGLSPGSVEYDAALREALNTFRLSS